MLVSEVEPIDKVGVNLLKTDDAEVVINTIIELPLRNACRKLMEKGVETFMSSANKNNVLKQGEKPKEKNDVYGNGQNLMSPHPTFEDAGKGYAWVMINFDTLSDDNKDLLFSLEERKGPNGESIGEKAIWFVHPFEMGNLIYDMKIGKYDYDFLRKIISEDEIPKDIQVDAKLAEFERRHIVLGYNPERYSTQTVILRMPINEQTTVEEVDEYFTKFAEVFKDQSRDTPNSILKEKSGISRDE